MNREEKIIEIPDETSPLVSKKEKNPIRFFYYKFLVWFYLFSMLVHLENFPALFGQEIPLSIRDNYLYPFAKYHTISILLVGVTPHIFLHFMSVSKDTYPTLKSNKAKQAGWWGIPLSASLGAICIPFVYYSVAGPLFYLYHRFCETNYVAGMTENLLVIGYGIVYIFSHEIWLLVLVSTYNEHVDILTMCKFVLQQLNRPRSVEV